MGCRRPHRWRRRHRWPRAKRKAAPRTVVPRVPTGYSTTDPFTDSRNDARTRRRHGLLNWRLAMAISKDLLEILVCPLCKATVELNPDQSGLKCVQGHRGYRSEEHTSELQ